MVVLAGTNPYSFDRLIRPIDELAGRHGWDVFVQLGYTDYVPQHCQSEKFIDRARLLELVGKSELVVAQGGYGSIRDALLFNKPLVAVPRFPELGEATDRQEELVRAMEELGYLIGVYDIAYLAQALERARGFVPSPRKASRIPGFLYEYLACQWGS